MTAAREPSPSLLRGFFDVALTMALIYTLSVIVSFEWDVLQTDVLRHNPNRDALSTALVFPLMAMIVAPLRIVFHVGWAMTLAAVTVAFAERRLRCAHTWWVYGLLAPVCFFAIYLQFLAPPHVADRPDLRDDDLTALELAYLSWLPFCGTLAGTWLWRTARAWQRRRR